MLDLFVFALIGLIAGAVAWLSYTPRVPVTVRIWSIVSLGVVGAVLGGLLSWAWWPTVEGHFHLGGVLMALLGALTLLWGYWAFTRRSRA